MDIHASRGRKNPEREIIFPLYPCLVALQNPAKAHESWPLAKPHMGSSFDDFLKEDGIYEEVQARANTSQSSVSLTHP